MDETDVLAYVKVTAKTLGLALDDARAQAVSEHFGRTMAMARLLEEVDMGPEDEPAGTFRPAPFSVVAAPGDLA
jgi:hypothetical protein